MNYKQLLEQLIDTFDGGDALQDLEGTDFASAKGLWIHLSGLYDDLLRGESFVAFAIALDETMEE